MSSSTKRFSPDPDRSLHARLSIALVHRPALIFVGLLLLCLSTLGVTIAQSHASQAATIAQNAEGTKGNTTAADTGKKSPPTTQAGAGTVPIPHENGKSEQAGQAPQVSPHPDREGGPDAYGYVFSDDRDPGGPVFNWVQATQRVSDSEWQETRTSDLTYPWDDGVVTRTLPFQFNLYGTNFSQIHVSTNGILNYGAPNDYWPQKSNACLPSNSTYVPQAMIAPLWYDFVVPLISDTIHVGGVFTDMLGTAPNRVYVVEWRNVYAYQDPSVNATLEALVYENGDMVYQYLSFNGPGVTGADGVVGIQNADGSIGLPYLCYQDDLTPQRAIRYRVQQDVFLQPGTLSGGGAPGSTLSYTETVRNQTGISNAFALSVASNVWTTTVTPAHTGIIANGGSANVTVQVSIPPGTPLGTYDTSVLTASSDLPTPGAYTDTAVITTTASTLGVDFLPPNQTKAGDYGSPITYTANLINKSGQNNFFAVSLEAEDWAATITPTLTGQIAPNASTPVTVTVLVPSNAVLAARNVLTVTAVGQLPTPGQFFGQTVLTATAGIWERKADTPTGRSRQAAVSFTANGRIYEIGGEYNNGSTNLPIQEYDPLADTWTARSFLNIGVSNVGAGVIGDAIYVPGGYSGQSGTTQNALQAYYPLEDRAATITSDPLPAPRFGAGVAVAGDKLYVIGGSDDTLHAMDTLFVYDPALPAGSRWQTKAPMPTARVYLGAAAVNDIIYAVGGIPGGLTDLNTVEAYNPGTNAWTTLAHMSVARGGPAAVGVDTGAPGCGGYLYAIGGGYLNYTASAERYDPTANVWTPISSLSMARRTLGGVYSPNTYSLMAFGGWNGDYESRTEAVTCEGGQVLPTATATVPVTPSATASATPVTCTIQFEDVITGSTFYPYVHCLACRGIINGYPCGGPGEPCNPTNDPYFRPNDSVTRGQLTKIVSESAGFNDAVSGQTFEDVQPGSTFYTYTERLIQHSVMSGYPCGGPGEPCGPDNKPYFRPNSGATRGQLTKIVSNAAGYSDPPQGQTFEDVQPGSSFYTYTQRLTSRGVMNGYPCGGAGEPCVPPNSRPYFRPNNPVTRGQTSKIVGNTFFPSCNP